MVAVKQDEAAYLDARLAHTRKVQTGLELGQLKILKLVQNTVPVFSPAVAAGQFVAVTVVPLCAGAATGTLL